MGPEIHQVSLGFWEANYGVLGSAYGFTDLEL